MKRSSPGVFVKGLLAGAILLVVVLVGSRKMQQRNMEQQVRAALAVEDRIARMQTFAHLRDTQGSEILAALVQMLDDPDEKIHSRAGSELPLFHETIGEVAPALVAHLHSSPYPAVRLCCAIMLMSVKSPAAHDAYLHALRDPFDKVVQLACSEVAAFHRKEDAEALYVVLYHPSWHARLEACKALITLKQVDQRVLSTLEVMRQDPEAARYDALIEDFDRREKEVGLAGEFGPRWGTLETIQERARQLAANP